jgi:hypothetical protein
MCRAKNGELMTKKDQVLSRWKEHFEQNLNQGEERDNHPTKPTLEIMELTAIFRAVKKLKAR